jgi:hypothetical protein
MGLEDYMALKEFCQNYDFLNLSDCIALCSNTTGGGNSTKNRKYGKMPFTPKEQFDRGTWTVKDISTAEMYADRIGLIQPYYEGYNRSIFVGTMLSLFKRDNFDFNEFMSKVRLQPTALVDCSNRSQYRALIEDIYNFKRRDKVNLKY